MPSLSVLIRNMSTDVHVTSLARVHVATATVLAEHCYPSSVFHGLEGLGTGRGGTGTGVGCRISWVNSNINLWH